jgi:hypothetical protein
MPPCWSAIAASEVLAPNSQPWSMKFCCTLTAPKTKIRRVLATPKPRAACTPAMRITVWRCVQLSTTTPLPSWPPANSRLTPSVLKVAAPAAYQSLALATASADRFWSTAVSCGGPRLTVSLAIVPLNGNGDL